MLFEKLGSGFELMFPVKIRHGSGKVKSLTFRGQRTKLIR